MKYTLYIQELMTSNGLIKASEVSFKYFKQMIDKQSELSKLGFTSIYIV